MRVQMFSITKPYFSATWKVDPEEMAAQISAWLQQNKGVEVKEIQHNVVASFWYPPQLIVFIYYVDKLRDS